MIVYILGACMMGLLFFLVSLCVQCLTIEKSLEKISDFVEENVTNLMRHLK